MPSSDAEFSLVGPMSASFRLANKKQEKIRENRSQVKFLEFRKSAVE